MQETDDITQKIETVRNLLEKHMGIKSDHLARGVHKAGRRLPRGVRKQAAILVEAETFAAHPKLMRQIDYPAVDRAYQDVSDHLRGLDLADARWGRFLNIAALIALNVLIVIVLVVLLLRWRGVV
ncbi:MAG: hypothetical protein AB8B47_11745 [Roseobacter sp.]